MFAWTWKKVITNQNWVFFKKLTNYKLSNQFIGKVLREFMVNFQGKLNTCSFNDCPYLVMGEPKIAAERPLQLWPRTTSNSSWPTFGHFVKRRFTWFSIQSKFFQYKITRILRKIIPFFWIRCFCFCGCWRVSFLAKVQENIPVKFEHQFDENFSKTPKFGNFVWTKIQNNKRWMFGK